MVASETRLRVMIGALGTMVGVLISIVWAASLPLAALEPVIIKEADLTFTARLDTGATISSINARDIEVTGGTGTPQRTDEGKNVQFTVENDLGEAVRIETSIAQVRGIKTSDCSELRYHVYLTVEHDGAVYHVLMNLNDRRGSRDKLLLGRNWLRHGFVVDVSRT
ncbi:MAG: hypothetical protein ACI915_001068 [Gammaproteobacteria bacterium]|jgi:hypothetical protein